MKEIMEKKKRKKFQLIRGPTVKQRIVGVGIKRIQHCLSCGEWDNRNRLE